MTDKRTRSDFSAGEVHLDSFKVRIPRSEVKILDPALESRWLLVNEATGEIDDRRAIENKVYRTGAGTSVKYSLENQTISHRKTAEFLTIGIPSKLLRSKYLQGIKADNWHLIYEALKSHGVADFSQESLLRGECTDIDLKKDLEYSGDFLADIVKLEQSVPSSRKKGHGYRSFKQKENLGIEFSERETTSFKSSPFLKIYAKSVELIHHSPEFVRDHLSGQDFSSIVRIETTIKNRSHYRYATQTDDLATFYNLLHLSPNIKNQVVDTAIHKHLTKPVIERKTKGQLRVRDLMQYQSIVLMLSRGLEWDEIKTALLKEIDCKSQRSRQRKFLEGLYRIYEADKECSIWPFINHVFSTASAA